MKVRGWVMIIKAKYYYLVLGFSTGFLLSLVGMTIEDYMHNILINKALEDFHHFITPLILGFLFSLLAYFYWVKKEHQIATNNQLIKNQAKNETMFSNISEVIAIINEKGHIVYKSPNILRYFGWLPEDLKDVDAWETVHPEDLVLVQGTFYKLLEKENATTTIRYRYKCKNGTYKPIQLTAINLIYHPNIHGVLCNYKDISEQIEHEQALIDNEYKFRTLFENMTDVVCMIDNNKNILDINSAASALYGYTRDELLNMPLEQLIYKDDKHISDTYFQKLENTGSYNMYEGRMITKTGDVKWIQVNATEFIKNGEKIGSQDIIRDITQRKNIEIELQHAVKQLHDLNATKDKLFSIIAHDLKSPFNSILGFAQLISKNIAKYDADKMKLFVDQIIASAKSTLTLLDNLLNWAKNQTGQISFNLEQIILSDVIGEIIEILNSAAKIKNIDLKCNQMEGISVLADKNMLKIVLLNLISNAIKFTELGGKIEISAITNQDNTQITISDNGIGMNEAAVHNLFNLEKKIITKGTANEQGSGLGLILCKDFVEKHGGKIWAESIIAKGSHFKFTLPV